MANRLKFLLSAALIALIGAGLLWTVDIRPGLLSPGALQPTQIQRTSQGKDFPVVITDAIGESIELKRPPQRIVSATLVTDEILSALVDSSRIAGVTFLADNTAISNVSDHYPDSIQRIQGEAEEIIALQPDLVFISPYTRSETVRLLLGAQIPIVRLPDLNTFSDIENSIKLAALATGTSEQAENILQAIQNKLTKLQTKFKSAKRPRVLFYNLGGTTAGPGSTIDEIIELAGGYNVIRSTGIKGSQKINEELAISLQPDVILVSGWVNQDGISASEQLKMLSAWMNVPAIKQQQVYDLNGGWLFSTSQFTWDGIQQVARILHPELFLAESKQL